MALTNVTKTISSANTWSDSIQPNQMKNTARFGHLAYSITIPDASTVTIQRDTQDGNGWRDVDTFTASNEGNIDDPTEGVTYRIGVNTGDYDSGSVKVSLTQ